MSQQNARPDDFGAVIAGLERRIKALEEPEPDTGWISMTAGLIAPWVVYEPGGATWAEPAYRRIGKRVQLMGLVKNGGTTSAMYTLPVGFRPKKSVLFQVPSNLCVLRIDVTPAGVITSNGVLAGTPDTGWTSLFPITYLLG